MDPKLQKMMAFRQRGLRKTATSSTAADEVAVIAKIIDQAAWEAMSEVRVGVVVGDPAPDGTLLVTARIPVSRIEHVRSQPFVKSLKGANRLKRALAKTIEETGARADLLPPHNQGAGGRGVVVGIVDFGCDFVHRNFRKTDGKTRVKLLWDQNGSGAGGSASPLGYGSLYKSAQINSALKKPAPYNALGYGPDPSEPAHGTHVMDIATGNGRGSGVPGMAPNADIIFVEVANSDIPWQGPEVVGKSFGDSVQLLEALKFIFDSAAGAPCVINVSLGTNGGPHDGSALVEQGIDRLVQQAPNRAVVIAASNSFADGIHAAGTVPQGVTFDLPWIIAANDQTENELELWYRGNARLSLDVIAPNGTNVATIAPGDSGSVSKKGKVILFAANRLNDPNNGDNMIGVYLSSGAPGGRWVLRLHGDPQMAVDFHAWVERDDYGQSNFEAPLDNSHTIGSISCGHETIVVGSYDAHKAAKPLSWFSSAGPTRDGRQKPEVSAPGHAVIAARSRSLTGTTNMSGTSMAAPATTGMIALVLAEAKSRNKTLSTLDIRNIVINAARRNPPPGTGWDSRHGNGRISVAVAVAAVIGSAPPSPTRKPGAAKKMTARVAAKKRSKAAGSAAKRAKSVKSKTRK
jgi:hypothetical protein